MDDKAKDVRSKHPHQSSSKPKFVQPNPKQIELLQFGSQDKARLPVYLFIEVSASIT
jgi:hypothetical protein